MRLFSSRRLQNGVSEAAESLAVNDKGRLPHSAKNVDPKGSPRRTLSRYRVHSVYALCLFTEVTNCRQHTTACDWNMYLSNSCWQESGISNIKHHAGSLDV